ncbi:MAG TPA: FadR/GntR family transcriptional regulator [Egibacteraceae bacterium]|nr:FadR/GntR family transcriptional regulator [Egibacteraceae bacterium]
MTKTGYAIEGLKELLLRGEVAPGERLPTEGDLAARLGVSRNVLREAVRALSHAGVLRTRQGDGTYVAEMDPVDLLGSVALYSQLATGARFTEVLEARKVIEPSLAAMAATRIDDEALAQLYRLLDEMERATEGADFISSDVAFHRVIADSCGNELLAGLLEAMTPMTVRQRRWRAVVAADSLTSQVHQHRSIADAIRAGDPEAARAAALLHVADVLRFFREHPHGPDDDEA